MPLTRPVSSLRPTAITVLALTFLLMPAIGSWQDTLVQDTLKSAVLAIGTLLAMVLWAAHAGQPTAAPPSTAAPEWGALPQWGRSSWQWHPVLLLPIALMGYALFSMGWGHRYLAATAAARWCIVGLVMWLALNGVQRGDLPRLLRALHGGACIAALWAACQFWFDLTLFTQGPSPASTFFNRNFYAEYAVSTLPFSAWLLARTHHRRGQWCVALTLTGNLCTIVMTSTRSALLTLVVILPMLACAAVAHYRRAPRSERPARRGLALACLALALVLLNIPSRSTHLDGAPWGVTAGQRSLQHAALLAAPGALQAGSVSVRRTLWLGTLRMLWQHPWSGVGAGAWEVHIPRYQDGDSPLEIDYYAHNEYLQLLSEDGWSVGGGVLALLAALVLQAAARTWRDARPSRNERKRTEGAATSTSTAPDPGPTAAQQQRFYALLALLALLIVSAAGFPWHLACTAGFLGLSLGLLGAADRAPQLPIDTPASNALPRNTARVLLGLAILGTLLAIYLTQRAVRAEYQLATALMMANKLPKDERPLDADTAARKAAMLDTLRAGIALNPHYRAFIPLAAEVMTVEGDWHNTAWILSTTVASRPYVYALWSGLTRAYIGLHEGPQALDALAHLRDLKPDAWSTRVLGIEALSIADQDEQALALLNQCLHHPDATMGFELPQVGYALGLKHQDQALALRALRLRNQYWPAQAADGYWRIGHVYATVAPVQHGRALQAFRDGWALVPEADRQRYRDSVPRPYQQQLPLSSSP